MQSGPSPQTTVVIAVWDDYAGSRLAEALASVAEQDGAKRVLIVDNASSVPVEAGAQAELVRTSRRLALGAARNFGLERVQTPYVVVWDADDVMLPGTLAFLERGIDADPRLAAFGAAIVESPSGVRHRWPRRWIGRLTLARMPFALLHCVWSLYPTTGATIMRTAMVRSAGGYADTESGEDWVLGVSLAVRGRIGWSERPGRIYRIHDQSVLARHSASRDLLNSARAVRERLRTDTELPRWVRAALPAIQIGQYMAIGLHAGLEHARRLRHGREPSTNE